MREILFRGKSESNNEWVYGFVSYNQQQGRWYEAWIRYVDKTSLSVVMEEVHPETVGQFTGTVDVNGNKIFEGDILLLTVRQTNHSGRLAFPPSKVVVRWNEDAGKWGWVANEFQGDEDAKWFVDFDAYVSKELEVLGNVHDNPLPKVPEKKVKTGSEAKTILSEMLDQGLRVVSVNTSAGNVVISFDNGCVMEARAPEDATMAYEFWQEEQ